MIKKSTIGLIALSSILAGGIIAMTIPNVLSGAVYSINDPFSISADVTDYKCDGGYSKDETAFTLKTRLGNPISFGYTYGMAHNSSMFQFKADGNGTLYNKDPLHYIEEITINYTCKVPMQITVGTYENPNGNYVPIESGVPFKVSGQNAFFKIKTGGNAAYLDKIYIKFNCMGADEPIIPDPGTSESSSESSSSSETNPNNEKTISFNAKTLTDGIIPTSYTSTGTKFKVGNINLFGNYFTNDYAGGYATNHIFLKEHEMGMIMNTNPITGLKSISLDGTINPTEFNIYGSNEFNSNWTKIMTNSATNIEINGKYTYFKITSNVKYFGFNNMSITYKSADSINNEVYTIKSATALSNESEVNALKTVSAEPFINSTYWTNKGYAANISEAKAEADNTNKKGSQSGYEGYIDYQITFNPDVVLNDAYTSYRVADMHYGDNGNSFRINMLDPNIEGPVIYKDCAYTYYEDVAAYIVAFGDVPPNMKYTKDEGNRAIADWGKDGRTNNTFYSNDNSGRFKFETECSTHRYLFNAQQNSNDYWYKYFENDLGASVGDNEPYQQGGQYASTCANPYNDGKNITRGTLRFVWTQSFTSREHGESMTSKITNSYDRNVFYTNNHYNDFQQYLNYYGGWSLRFGNTELGNGWNKYIKNNHLHASPEVILTSLSELQK